MAYRYNADHLAQERGKYNPQKDNMGMLELHVDGLVPGGQEILMLSLVKAEMPNYKVARGNLEYLNGTVFYPKKPEPLGEMTTSFRDYHDAGSREVLERLHRKVYDPRTGLQNIPANVKSQASFMLLREDGQRGREYFLDGIFPLDAPPLGFDFVKTGDAVLMEIKWSVDFIVGKNV